jgi:hypothetical protein
MCLVVAIFFRSAIKIRLHACVWWGTRLDACSWWSDDIQSRTYFYVIHIYANIKRFSTSFMLDRYLRSNQKVFTLEHGDMSTSEPHFT